MNLTLDGAGGGGSLNPLNPSIALTVGLITSISLLTNAISDQQFWQRCFTIRKKHLRKSFIFAALLFATIPIGFSLLGFLAASPNVGVSLSSDLDPALIGFAVVKHLLPPSVASLYMIILLAGLCSTLDSGLSAASSLYALLQRGLDTKPRSAPMKVKHGRIAMLVVSAIGLALAYAVEYVPGFGLKYLFWAFGTMGACVVVPTVLSLYWNRLQAKGVLVSFSIGVVIGLPLVVYASITGNNPLLAATYVGIILQSTVACIATARPAGEFDVGSAPR